MAIEPVKIPTNIAVEEKIIGPLSLRQIIILMLTGGFSYALWTALTKSGVQLNIVTQALCLVPFILGIAFSFVQVNGVSLLTLLLLMIERIEKPTVRTFGMREGIHINLKFSKESLVEPVVTQAKNMNLEELSSVLDAGQRQNVPAQNVQMIDIQNTNDENLPEAQIVDEDDADALWDTPLETDSPIFKDIFPSS